MAKKEVLLEVLCKHIGNEFHVDGPATANARPPYVTRQWLMRRNCQLMAGNQMENQTEILL